MSWEATIAEIRSDLEAKHAVRETVLKTCRITVQTCSKAIKHIHRRDTTAARELLDQARLMVTEAREVASTHADILHAGYIQDAEKELVEGELTLSMILEHPFPNREKLGVSSQTYLNGAGEAASELRRFLLDRLRHGEVAEAERLLGTMESVYQDLTTFDFPDSLTGGLRRTCDALRAVVERTRSDVTMTVIQKELVEQLRLAAENRSENPPGDLSTDL